MLVMRKRKVHVPRARTGNEKEKSVACQRKEDDVGTG